MPRPLGALVLGLFVFLGCGPVEYLSQVSGRAASALASARREKADKYATYEFIKASEFYRKAREEGGHSSYQVAIEYGRRAEELAHTALSLTRQRVAAEQGGPTTPQVEPVFDAATTPAPTPAVP